MLGHHVSVLRLANNIYVHGSLLCADDTAHIFVAPYEVIPVLQMGKRGHGEVKMTLWVTEWVN